METFVGSVPLLSEGERVIISLDSYLDQRRSKKKWRPQSQWCHRPSFILFRPAESLLRYSSNDSCLSCSTWPLRLSHFRPSISTTVLMVKAAVLQPEEFQLTVSSDLGRPPPFPRWLVMHRSEQLCCNSPITYKPFNRSF